MDCVTGKVCFETSEKAEEALVNNRIRYNSGPTTFYRCNDCGLFHFTSQGSEHSSLSEQQTKDRIERERDAGYWEDKLGR